MKTIVMTALTIVLAVSICTAVSAEHSIIVCGTGDSQSLMRTLAAEYEQRNPGHRVIVPDSIGSGGGILATAKGKCDLGRVARKIKDKERTHGLNFKTFAISPVVFAANPSVRGIDNLTSGQIVSIFSGKTRFWSELGGEKWKIYVANREKGDSSRTVLEENLEGFKNIGSLAGKTIYSTPETVETISNYRNTIGYIDHAFAIKAGLIIMKIDNIAPSTENIQNGTYNYTSPLGFVWKGELSGLAKDFMAFISGPVGQRIIIANGVVPVL